MLVSNPNAGRGGARRALALARFREALAARGVETEVWETRAPGDASRLAARAAREGARTLIVSGGDGTINEALQGVIGKNLRLAVWPAGTANVLGRELRMPFDAARAAEVVARGRTLRVTVGCATGEGDEASRRYFLLMAGVGLDASVVSRVPARLKRRAGEAAFWYAGLGHLARWRPKEFTVEVGGESYRATFAAVGKAPRWGGGLAVTPRARLDAEEFEVCLVNSRSRLRYLRLLGSALRGGAKEGARGVRFLRAARVGARGDALVQLDGELVGSLPMTFEVVPERLEIIVP